MSQIRILKLRALFKEIFEEEEGKVKPVETVYENPMINLFIN